MKIRMELGSLIHCLACSGVKITTCKPYDPATKIQGIERLQSPEAREEGGIVYLCDGANRPKAPGCIVLALESVPDDADCNHTVFLMEDERSFDELYLYILECLTEYLGWNAEMERLISEAGTIQQLVSISELYFPAPLAIFNTLGELVAKTETVATDYKPFLEIVEKKRMLTEVISKMRLVDPATASVSQTRGIHVDKAKQDDAVNIYRSCFLMGHVVFRCCIFCNTETPSEEFQWFAECFFRRIERYIERNKELFHADTENEAYLLRTLVSGTYADKDYLMQNLAYCKIPLQGNFFLINFLLKDVEYQRKNLLIQKLRALGEIKCFLHNDGVVALLNLKGIDQKAKNRMAYYTEKIDALLEEYQTIAAVSNEFEEIFSVFGAYMQTEKALELVQKLKPIAPRSDFFRGKTKLLHYKEVFTYHLLYDIGEWTINENCVAKELLRYIQQSRLPKEDILKTLYVHISNGCRHNVTAQLLSLHRNTVANRMEQMEEQLSISLDNFEDCINVILAIKAIECGFAF